MVRVMMVLGLLVLVPAALVFWRMRKRAAMPASADKRIQRGDEGRR